MMNKPFNRTLCWVSRQLHRSAEWVDSINTPDVPAPKKPDTGIISYAQNFEDVMLWRALGRVENGFYIDVGAHDPVVDSVSKAFYEHGWRGIHIEPIAEYAQALRLARPGDEVIEAILAADATQHTYYFIPKTGLSTGVKEFAERHKHSGWEVLEQQVPSTTLEAVFEKAKQQDIHWLKVDVEGMEDDVFKGWHTHPARPWVVVVEATEPNSETPTWHLWENHLIDKDYVLAYFDGLNRFYIHAKHKELVQVFQIPPNIFDGFCKFQM
jgi:FkbM family methyltransferase